jgi:hypothetical protein
MTNRGRPPTPSVRRIAEWWIAHGELERVRHLGVNAVATCWACSYTAIGFTPERAHIVAHSAGGSSVPSNLLLLCSRCHREQPDGAPRSIQIMWAQNHQNCWETAARESQSVLESIRATGATDADLAAFLAERPDFIVAAQQRAAAAPHRSNAVATLKWSIVAEFTDWKARHRPPADDRGQVQMPWVAA